jgi:hypothetical protein
MGGKNPERERGLGRGRGPAHRLRTDGATFTSVAYELDGYGVIDRPPARSGLQNPLESPKQVIIDGQPGYEADTLVIDFYREDFDRRMELHAASALPAALL